MHDLNEIAGADGVRKISNHAESPAQPAPASPTSPASGPASPLELALAAAQATLAEVQRRMAAEKKPALFLRFAHLASTLTRRIASLSIQAAEEADKRRAEAKRLEQEALRAAQAPPPPVRYAPWPRCTRYQFGHKWRKDNF